jgi:hypothetical protein
MAFFGRDLDSPAFLMSATALVQAKASRVRLIV